jgi:hypothetical protein
VRRVVTRRDLEAIADGLERDIRALRFARARVAELLTSQPYALPRRVVATAAAPATLTKRLQGLRPLAAIRRPAASAEPTTEVDVAEPALRTALRAEIVRVPTWLTASQFALRMRTVTTKIEPELDALADAGSIARRQLPPGGQDPASHQYGPLTLLGGRARAGIAAQRAGRRKGVEQA